MIWKYLQYYYLVFNLITLSVCQNWRDKPPTVRLNQGLLEGSRIFTDSGKTVDTFLGIPYASPPVRNLRFAPPQKHPGWNGTFQATNYGARCPQLPINSGANDNEDCLSLNIWSPQNAALYAPLPVIIFFEGNNFERSSVFPISGQDLSAEGLIIVSINYRLNVFGFFCLGTSEVRGNFGLLDQYFGILWVKENIKQFGGDSEKITLYGHFSGGVSVVFHMISPRTAGLFQRAIISHGSAVTPWQLHNDPIAASRKILRMLGCDGYTTNPLSCIRTKSVEHILQALAEYSENYMWIDKFLPVIDTFLPESNRYLPLDPDKALKGGTYLQVPVLTGISKPIADEQFMRWLELASQGYSQLQQYTEKAKIPEIIRLYRFNLASKDQIYELIKWKYFSINQGDVRILFDQLKKLEFEAKIQAPHYLQLSHLVSSYVQPIYVYFMNDIGFVPNTTDPLITSDLLLLFGPILLKQISRRRFNQNEMNLSRMLKQFWANFVIFGNPTPTNQMKEWRKYTSNDYFVEQLRLPNLSNNKFDKNQEDILYWNQLLPKLASIKNNLSNYIPKELQNSPDPAAGFRHAMYTLVALVIALLALLLICIVLLKKRSKERESQLHMGY